MNMPASNASDMVATYTYAEYVKLLDLSLAKGMRTRRQPPAVPPRNTTSAMVLPGSRNTMLTSLGGFLRRQGFEQEQIETVLNTANEALTTDPLDPAEVGGIAGSVSRYESSDPAAVLASLTDTGNAERFVRKWYQTVRYVPEWRKWIVWNGSRWVPDDVQHIIELAKTTAREIHTEAAAVSDKDLQAAIAKHAMASQKLERLKAMVKLAESIPELIVRAADLDKDRFLLGVQNGVLDLRTGKLRPADPAHYVTRQAPVAFDPNADCPTFKRFLSTIAGDKQDLVDYLQRIMGYGLTGETTEQCLFFFYGFGANGKSTLLNVIKDVLGPDYCKQTPSDTLMAKTRGGGATNDLARLEGVRVALSNEVEEGSRLAESTVKQLTGGDPVTARYLYKEFFEYVPQHKIIIAGNHQPVIRGEDTGIWRRLHLVPFEVTIPLEQRDHRLPEKLRAELQGILNFAVEGCLKWQADGLQPPKEVKEAVSEYKSEMDILGQWIEENCLVAQAQKVSSSVAYDDYKNWAIRNGHQVLSSNAFGRRLKLRHERKHDRTGTFYLGLAIKPYRSDMS